MSGILVNPRVTIPPQLQQGGASSWMDAPFSDAGGVLYQSADYVLAYTLAGPTAPVTLTGAAQGTGWLSQISSVQTAALAADVYYWQARLTANADASVIEVARGQLLVEIDFSRAGVGFDGRTEAAQNLSKWKAALAALSGKNGPPVSSYRVGMREMRYQDIGDVMKSIAYWQAQVLKETTADSIKQGQGNPRKTYVRFPGRTGTRE